MRKRYKKKRRSCSVCKPHKRGITMRWSGREEQRLKDRERERRRGWFEVGAPLTRTREGARRLMRESSWHCRRSPASDPGRLH